MAVPKIRFKANDGSEFPDWEHLAVSELFSLVKNINTGGTNKNVITNSAEYGLIPQRNFFDKDIAVAENTDKYTVIEKGDFVYNPRKSSSAPFGPFNCYAEEQDGIVSPLYFCLRPKRAETTSYLLYYFASPAWHRYIYNNGSQGGARHDRVGMTNCLLLNMPISLPCAEEQQKIYDNLSTLDIVIEDCQSEVEAWEKYKYGVMQQLFSQKVRFKADDGSKFPEWKDGKIKDILTICHGKDYKEVENRDEKYPVLGTGGIITKVDSFLCDWPCVLIGRKGTIDKPQYMDEPFWCVDTLFYSKPEQDQSTKFQYYLFQTINWKRYNEASGVPSLTASTIEDIKIKIPCLEEQQKIADCLSAFDEVIDKAKQKLEEYKRLKKGVLQQMFV